MSKATVERATCSIDDWCRRVGVSRNYGYQLARANKIPGLIRVGNRLVVSLAALEAMLAGAGTQEATA